MHQVLKLNRLMPLLATVCALAALGYAKMTPKLFDVSTEVLLRRTQVEPIEGAGESGKNRWVWVRDGLAIKEELTSDAVLGAVLADVPELAVRRDAFVGKGEGARDLAVEDQNRLYFEALRRQVTVVFNGADESVYRITVRDQDAKLARRVAESLIGQLKHLAVDEAAAARQAAVKALGQKELASEGALGATFVNTAGSRAKERIEDYRVFLAARDELHKAEDESRVRILKHPVKADLAWPKIPFLMIAAAFFGCAVALVVDLKRTGGFKRLLVA